jgi:hypothetical protein
MSLFLLGHSHGVGWDDRIKGDLRPITRLGLSYYLGNPNIQLFPGETILLSSKKLSGKQQGKSDHQDEIYTYISNM